MIKDVSIRGFSRGILMGAWEYGITFENLRVSGQRVAGIDNINNTLSIRRMVSRNTVPAIISDGSLTSSSPNYWVALRGVRQLKTKKLLF